mmetsp:Transcript_19186/g.44549  ORF Transcript_19186/g.44549 Transcript_19186/m.44549 type:complete len:262 (-) Transcript_19186:243-1028(-)
MPPTEYGAIGADVEETAAVAKTTDDADKNTHPHYQFMAKVMNWMDFLAYDPSVALFFFDDPDEGLKATVIVSFINLAIQYYWYMIGGSNVRFRILSVLFVLVYGPYYLVTRESDIVDNAALRDHLLGDRLAPYTCTILFVLNLVSWKMGYPYIRDYIWEKMDDEAQMVHPLTLRNLRDCMMLWTGVFFLMAVLGWWSVADPDAVSSQLQDWMLLVGFVLQAIYSKHFEKSYSAMMDLYTDEIAAWNAEHPDVGLPLKLSEQ